MFRLYEFSNRMCKQRSFLFNKKCWQFFQLRSETKLIKNTDITKIRNIGIIAHIDAGKTTTTERMLYYSGLTNIMGEVHDGDTVMDYMPQERERGITITSAAITFSWRKHQINLIDTPGHVDFTFEVERSLSALDGAITILDSSAGVEVQTVKVWDQANRYRVPSIVYLNKMDKPASDVDMCLFSLTNKLKVKPLLLHLPIGNGKNFRGVVDIVFLQKVLWNDADLKNDGQTFSVQNLDMEKDKELWWLASEKREKLIENIADMDDTVAEKYICNGSNSLTVVDLQTALHRITLKKLAVPVLCGSSYKNIGVQLLMDATINYLPNPKERHRDFVNYDSDELFALVFKIIHTKNKEPLTFLRIYSGCLKCGQRVYNVNLDISEKVGKLMVSYADDFREIASLSSGNIAVVSGLKQTATGHLISSSSSAANKVKQNFLSENRTSTIPSIQIPDPVFFCTVEPPSLGMQKHLDFALRCLQREDPTFHVEVDETIGQTVLMGMGELHIDVIKERIRTEYGIDAYLGPLQVAYRETLQNEVVHTHILDKMIACSKQYAKITLKIYPQPDREFIKEVKVIITKENGLGKIRSDHLKSINLGMQSALNNGPLLSFPVINVGVDLLWLEVGKGTSLSVLSAVTSQCIYAALRKSVMHLLEPVMNLYIVVNKGYAGRVLNDLSQKRSQILNMESRQDIEIIHSQTPLVELRGYSTNLRAITSGRGSFTMEFGAYQKMDSEEQTKTVQEVTGFVSY